MAVGDLVTVDLAYELGGVLLGPPGPWTVTDSGGYLEAEAESEDMNRDDDHGAVGGTDLYPGKWLTLEVKGRRSAVDASIHTYQALRRAAYSVHADIHATVDTIDHVFQLPNLGKRICAVRPRRRRFTTTPGAYHGLLGLWMPDPRFYAFVESNEVLTLGVGTLSASQVFTNTDDFPVWPVIEIGGPATNPRILNNASGRTVRVDIVLTAGQTLILDAKAKSITLAGVNRYDVRRTDNQWWTLLAGANNITYTRSSGNTGASSALRIKWRGAVIG